MPQPLSSNPTIKVLAFTGRALEKHPNLAAKTLWVLSAGSEAESQLGSFLSSFSNGQKTDLARYYVSLTNDSSKNAALSALSVVHLTHEEQTLFDRVYKTHRSKTKLRNEFAHSRMSCSENGEYLVLINTRNDIMFSANLIDMINSRSLSESEKVNRKPIIGPNPNEMQMCYSGSEIEKIAKSLDLLASTWARLREYVESRNDETARARILPLLETHLQDLC